MKKYELWLQETVNDKEMQEELLRISNDEKAIEDRFYKALEFGTGGLRGVLGAGENRMNDYTVGRATFGLADYLLENNDSPKVVIAYDSRKKSAEFALLAADIFSYKGIKAYLFDKLTPTPVLSYAVRYFAADAGIVITASHNPKEYNGYKVYNKNGCQITDNAAKMITDRIANYGYFTPFTREGKNVEMVGDGITDSFIADIMKYSLFDKVAENCPSIVYTPLHGTGNLPVRKVLAALGVKDVYVVHEQELPDAEFTTCPYPNPEEKEALSLAVALAKEKNAELVFATDPDADRIGIAVKDGDEYVLLNGNETGCLLENYILERRIALGLLPKNGIVVKTIVTSDMATRIAESFDLGVREVLTGFKYIGETIDSLEDPNDYVFGLEESYGYLVGTHARDKDAVSAAMLIVEAYAYYRSLGVSLTQKLSELYERYGFYKTALISRKYAGIDGQTEMKKIVDGLRSNPWGNLLQESVSIVKDYSKGVDGLPKSNVLRFESDSYKILVRPSGTEPKLKIYLQAIGQTEDEAILRINALKTYVEGKI